MGSWIGLPATLEKIGIEYKFNKGMKRLADNDTRIGHIKFADGILTYGPKTSLMVETFKEEEFH